MAKSKGIPRSIDLTENRVFSHGVEDNTLVYDEVSKEIPWDKDGNKKNIKLSQSNLYSDLFLSDSSGRSITGYRINSQFTTYIDYDFWYNNGLTGNHEIDVKTLKKFIDEHPLSLENVDEYINQYTALFDIVCDSITSPITAAISNNIGLCLSKVFNYNTSYNVANNTSYISFTTTSRNTSDNYIMSQSWLTDDALRSQYLNTQTYDITPDEFKDCNVSEDEYNGAKIITGHKDEIIKKRRKIEFYNTMKRYLDNVQDRYTNVICTTCGKTFHHIFSSEYGKVCPYCRIKKEELFIPNRYKNLLDERYYYTSGYRCEPNTKRSEDDFHTRRSNLYNNTYDLLESDQHHIKVSKERGTIDYFVQPIYTDRGVDLLRIPQRSHELQVDLSTGIIKDDDNDEKRKRAWDKPRLTTNRELLENGFNYNGTLSLNEGSLWITSA